MSASNAVREFIAATAAGLKVDDSPFAECVREFAINVIAAAEREYS